MNNLNLIITAFIYKKGASVIYGITMRSKIQSYEEYFKEREQYMVNILAIFWEKLFICMYYLIVETVTNENINVTEWFHFTYHIQNIYMKNSTWPI